MRRLLSAFTVPPTVSDGGVGDPVHRKGFEPVGFRPHQNPFYVALSWCDLEAGRLKTEAAKVVPWFIASFREARAKRV